MQDATSTEKADEQNTTKSTDAAIAPVEATDYNDIAQEDSLACTGGAHQSESNGGETVQDGVSGAQATQSRSLRDTADPQTSEASIVEQPSPLPLDYSVIRLIENADHSAGKLVNLLVKYLPCFRDEARFDRKRVRLFKRAQIFVADLWAAFGGAGYGEFHDIANLTMFAGKCSECMRVDGVRPC